MQGKKKKTNPSHIEKSPKSLDDFLATWSDDEDNSSEESPGQNGTQNGQHKINGHKKPVANDDENSSSASEDDASSDTEPKGEVTKQKKYLAGLKDNDPEFFEFLKENDKELLDFDESSSEDEEGEDEKYHQPPEALEVASDESDFEEDEKYDGEKGSSSKLLTTKQIDNWTEQLKQKPDIKIIATVIQAFRDAIEAIADNDQTDQQAQDTGKGKKKKKSLPKENQKYVCKGGGGAIFNSIARLCLSELSIAIGKVLKIENLESKQGKDPRKSKSWGKLNKHLKMYTMDLTKLLKSGGGGEPGSVVSAVLKHVHGLIPYYSVLPKSAKILTRNLITLWSSHKEESVRVLSFMCILRLARRALKVNEKSDENDIDIESDGTQLESIMKQMYMAYIRNVKFTSPNSWPIINFMRRSLAEIFNLDPVLSYRYAFVYIRQLTIHLRNAMLQQGTKNTSQGSKPDSSQDKSAKKKKEPTNKKDVKGSSQIVCNWQFIHSVHLWVQLLCDSNSSVLEPLVYPLVQLITGAIRLVYAQKAFYPFRFHLCHRLIQLSASTGKFVPILPYYLDILSEYNFGKKTAKVSMKPMDFSCIVKCSKSQLTENGFKDSVMNEIYAGVLECLHYNSSKIAFPELIVPALVQMRQFVKKSRIANYTKKIKQLLDKSNENVQFVLANRRKVNDFGVRDLEKIRVWESALRQKGPPLSKYYESWSKVKEQETLKAMSDQVNLDDYNFIPKLNKNNKVKSKKEFKGIFDEDEDSDEDDLQRFELKEDRNKKRKIGSSEDAKEKTEDLPKKKSKKQSKTPEVKPLTKEEEEEDDEVKEFDIDDFSEIKDKESEDEAIDSQSDATDEEDDSNSDVGEGESDDMEAESEDESELDEESS